MPFRGEIAVEPFPHATGDPEDVRLVRDVLAGDLGAFDSILERHRRKVTSTVRRLLADPNDLEDTVQETFVRAFRHLGRFRGECSLRTWLLRIAINVCRDRARRAWFQRVLLIPEASLIARGRSGDFEAATADLGLRDELSTAIRELPQHLRVPFVLHALEELSGAEIAEVLGWNASTVWTRIYAARRALRKKLAAVHERHNSNDSGPKAGPSGR